MKTANYDIQEMYVQLPIDAEREGKRAMQWPSGEYATRAVKACRRLLTNMHPNIVASPYGRIVYDHDLPRDAYTIAVIFRVVRDVPDRHRSAVQHHLNKPGQDHVSRIVCVDDPPVPRSS